MQWQWMEGLLPGSHYTVVKNKLCFYQTPEAKCRNDVLTVPGECSFIMYTITYLSRQIIDSQEGIRNQMKATGKDFADQTRECEAFLTEGPVLLLQPYTVD